MLSRKQTLASALVLAALGSVPAPSYAQYPQDRYAHSTTLLPDGSILIAGGRTSGGAYRGLERFYPEKTGGDPTFIENALLPGPDDWIERASHTATLMPNGRVLIAGGYGPALGTCHGGGVCHSVQVYDPVAKRLTNVEDLTTARMNHTATLLPNGLVLIAGGNKEGAGSPETDTCELYNARTSMFETNCGGVTRDLKSMGLARACHAATLLGDGRALVTGGYTLSSTEYGVSTEFFDYRVGDSGKWLSGPALIAKRALHTATQMGNGKVLIAGGLNEKNEEENLGYLETAEVYDPITNKLTPAKKMQARKAYHASILSGDGRVQLYGGLGNITTTYYEGALELDKSSQLTLNTDAGDLAGVLVTGESHINSLYPATNLPIRLTDIPLSSPVSGRIVKGRIALSSPTVTLSDASIMFSTMPPGAYAELDGIDAKGGLIINNTVPLIVSGTVTWRRQSISPDDSMTSISVVLPRNAICFDTPVPAGGGSKIWDGAHNVGDTLFCPTTAGAANNQIQLPLKIPMPKSNANGNVYVGSARLKAATFSNQMNNWMATLKDGVAVMANGDGDDCLAPSPSSAVQQDEDGNIFLECTMTFKNLVGAINNTGTQNIVDISTPVANTLIESISISIIYAVSPIDISNTPIDYDISTITVRQMLFSDEENYTPLMNTWAFGYPAAVGTFGHSAVLLPNADSVIIGGRYCSGKTGCGAFDFLTRGSYTAYIPQAGGDGAQVVTEELQQPMSKRRRNLTATLLPDGKLLVAGGSDGPTAVAEAEILDPDTLRWSPAGAMITGRSNHSATLMPNGTVLVAGGFQSAGSTGTTNKAEIYFPETRTWVQTSPMISSRSYHTSTLLPDGNVLVTGGMENGNFLITAEVYHSTSMVWEQVPDMKHATAQHTATLLQDGRVLVVGGVNGIVLGSAMIYDPTEIVADQWTDAATMPTAPTDYRRHSHTATMLRDGRVLIAGGNDGTGEIGRGVIFDPRDGALGSWWRTSDENSDMNIPRFNHAALLLPNGKVLFSGGFKKDGTPVQLMEGFDVDFSTWQPQGMLTTARGDHASVIGKDGSVLFVGGYNGINSLETAEYAYFTHPQDRNTPDPLPRTPQIVSVSTPIFNRGEPLTVLGSRFGGAGEASGAGAAAASSQHAHPRVYLQRLDSTGNNGGNSSGFMVDLTSHVFYQKLNIPPKPGIPGDDMSGWLKWSNSSMSFVVPTSAGLLPYGFYHLRVAANSQFSKSHILLAGPPRPAERPGVPYGRLVGVSSIAWSWSKVTDGTCDGYNVYSATTGVFISTVSPTAIVGGMVQFIQTGLGPDTSGLIRVAPYTISGDGPVSVSTLAVRTLSARVYDLSGTAQDEASILWSWKHNDGALSYNVLSTTAPGTILFSTTSIKWTQTLLSTNTAYSVKVQAETAAGLGDPTEPATVYTKAAPPLGGSPPIQDVTTTTFRAVWEPNTNPPGTRYVVRGTQLSDFEDPAWPPDPQVSPEMTATTLDIPDLEPNTLYKIEVAAVNGDGVLSPSDYTTIGTTATKANEPTYLTATGDTPSSLVLSWDRNYNSPSTTFEVSYSREGDFGVDTSTRIAFSDNFTSTGTTLIDLYTGVTYYIRVNARNYYGDPSKYAQIQAFTDNGGGPQNSIAVLARVGQTATLHATLLENENTGVETRRLVSITVHPNTFPVDTHIYISSWIPSVGGCTAEPPPTPYYLPAIKVTTDPPGQQPAVPITIGISYKEPTEGSVGTLATLGMVRSEANGNCVRLRSSVNQTLQLVTAETNHLSIFQLMKLAASRDIGEARVFPNPLYTHSQAFFTFDRLAAFTRVRVYTLLGEEVYDAKANASGVFIWNAQNKAGRPVASGLYLAVVQNGNEKKILKLAVVR